MEEKVFFPFNSPSRVVRVERVSAYGWKQQQKDRRMSKRFFFGGKNCLEEKKESPISDRDGQLVAINISLINNVDKMYRSGLLRLTRQLTKLGIFISPKMSIDILLNYLNYFSLDMVVLLSFTCATGKCD